MEHHQVAGGTPEKGTLGYQSLPPSFIPGHEVSGFLHCVSSHDVPSISPQTTLSSMPTYHDLKSLKVSAKISVASF